MLEVQRRQRNRAIMTTHASDKGHQRAGIGGQIGQPLFFCAGIKALGLNRDVEMHISLR
jgi:hypothetical protein